ncbi:winged helix-turn-helix domain-containing protein [Candidatus Wolfebacteria bacterium]|nr:winged helix-turn-helix domain-containing protein [Candidatus Wolfebacteria bacterium]
MTMAIDRGKIDYRKVERTVKGFANHNRLKILELLHREPELSVADVSEKLKMGYENTSDHIRKLAAAGLVTKRSDGPNVLHKLTPRAKSILVFCKTLQ